jgi:hypothetical protein
MASSACHRKPQGLEGPVNSKGFIAIVVAPLLACLPARLLPFLASLVLLLGLLGLAALRWRVIPKDRKGNQRGRE